MLQVTDEFARQRALDTYRVLDSLPETAYDDIVRLAAVLCDAPIALISLIDRDRQWFKSRQGIEIAGGPRDEAFCDHVIRHPDRLMEVPDATADARFTDNPFVTGDDAIRFYAGMPLVTRSGAAIGTVCVLDRERRELTQVQKDGLSALARITMNLLEARHRLIALERAALLAQAHPGPTPAPIPTPTPAPEPAATRPKEAVPVLGFTVAIFEVQDLPAVSRRVGERGMHRLLEQVQESLQAGLVAGSTDTVSHATGSAEMIVVLHGNHAAAGLKNLRDFLPGIERDTGMLLIAASADSVTPQDRIEQVFLRADEALSREKDALASARERRRAAR